VRLAEATERRVALNKSLEVARTELAAARTAITTAAAAVSAATTAAAGTAAAADDDSGGVSDSSAERLAEAVAAAERALETAAASIKGSAQRLSVALGESHIEGVQLANDELFVLEASRRVALCAAAAGAVRAAAAELKTAQVRQRVPNFCSHMLQSLCACSQSNAWSDTTCSLQAQSGVVQCAVGSTCSGLAITHSLCSASGSHHMLLMTSLYLLLVPL
jgi:hypothetical protein